MKKLTKDTKKLVGAGVTLGAGSLVLSQLEYKSGRVVSGGMATMGGMMSPVTTGVMGYHTVTMVKKLYKPKKKR